MTGLFITLEGGEGAGKSTQARLLAEWLRAQGHDVDLTREPGGTPGAEALRELLLFGGHGLCARAEVMAHFAARADHVEQRIAPMLARGGVVICDRFTDSTEAYQGYGLSHGDPAMLGLIATLRGLIPVAPDLTFMLEVPPAVAQALRGELAARDFLAGAAPTIADVACYAYVAHAPEGNVSLDAYPHVRAWLGRIEAALRHAPHNPRLQYLAGMACLQRQLWGKAQQLLGQSTQQLKDQALLHSAWTALAILAERHEAPDEAARLEAGGAARQVSPLVHHFGQRTGNAACASLARRSVLCLRRQSGQCSSQPSRPCPRSLRRSTRAKAALSGKVHCAATMLPCCTCSSSAPAWAISRRSQPSMA